ncbi:hypothetical protein ACFV0O_03740 [Kitasatospora sp. NPDC059577]|uniref:hypothetical protein n=1 Tax=Kitasatospora sp. NPDC059577 TaxID=3346873 RepID=UPI00368161E1
MSSNGWALVLVDAPRGDPLLVVADVLGRRQLHRRGDRLGVIGSITASDDPRLREISLAWRDHVDEYQAVGLRDLGCHTDGAFVDGPGVAPSALLILHCARPATVGSANLLVDGSTLFDLGRAAAGRHGGSTVGGRTAR